ncbi:MAG TPA: hypothetical protein VMV62_01200 [Candidatus Paceibacterota bacterium]|nr:hypothetical protein [Candidatus Paceibacterota bacterium]
MEDEKLLPPGEPIVAVEPASIEPEPQVVIREESLPGVPSPKQQQWGVLVSIIIIVMMIIVGAFYAWGKRIAQEQQYPAPTVVK